MIEMIDEYSANLEQIVAERTRELEQDMATTENLLYQLLPKWVENLIIQFDIVSYMTNLIAEASPTQSDLARVWCLSNTVQWLF